MIYSIVSPLFYNQYRLGVIASGFELCPGLHEGRHDVGHFGNATERGVFTDAGQLAVFAGCEGFKLTSFHSFLSISMTSAGGFIFIQ